MKTLVTVMAAALAATVLAQGPAAPETRRPDRHGMRPPMSDPIVHAVMSPRVAEKIGLSDEQKAKLKELNGNRAANRELQEKIRKGMERQTELLKAEKVDEAAVMAAIDEVFEARKEMAKAQTKRVIAVRSILTPEQVAKAREAMKEMNGPRGPKGSKGPKGPKERTPKAEPAAAPVPAPAAE